MGRRRRRKDRTSTGEVLGGLVEMFDVIWGVLAFLVRIPALLLRLLT